MSEKKVKRKRCWFHHWKCVGTGRKVVKKYPHGEDSWLVDDWVCLKCGKTKSHAWGGSMGFGD